MNFLKVFPKFIKYHGFPMSKSGGPKRFDGHPSFKSTVASPHPPPFLRYCNHYTTEHLNERTGKNPETREGMLLQRDRFSTSL